MFAQTSLLKTAVMEIHCFILLPLLNISLICNSKSFANSKSMGLAWNISFLSFFEHMLVENRYIIVKQNKKYTNQNTKPEGQSTRYSRSLQEMCQKWCIFLFPGVGSVFLIVSGSLKKEERQMAFTVRIGVSYRSKQNAHSFLEEWLHPGRVSKLLFWEILCLCIITSINLCISMSSHLLQAFLELCTWM